jgi:hypothetical protein
MAVSVIGLGLLLGSGRVAAQSMTLPPMPSPQPTHEAGRLVFDKEPNLPSGSVERASFQQPNQRIPDALNPQAGIPDVDVEPPGPGRIFGHLDSEADLQQRLRQKELDRTPGVKFDGFPEEHAVSTEQFQSRAWPSVVKYVEPNYVSYDRLYFEDRNSERYGWDLGLLQPFISAGYFYTDLALVPYRFFSEPCRCHDTSAGLCLPGDPVPYTLYPVGASVKGGMGEAAAIISLVLLFP